jgi:glutaminyl-tRNA synthetase
MRDPAVYRIKKEAHHRTGSDWCIYPMYDFAHGLSDALEGITHSICTLEFEVHRPLYDWFLDQLDVPARPRQYEFARLNLTYTVLSKRFLQRMVEERIVEGWDDPRMPTLAGLRRRGYPPEAIRSFCDTIGVTKYDGFTELALLEHSVRDYLNRTAARRMAVVRPLRVVIENYPEGEEETFSAVNNPEDPAAGTREVPFSRVLYIERDDFMEDPPRKFHRLAPGREVRLRYACLLQCREAVHDPETGEIAELRCTWDPDSRGGSAPDGRKVKGTIHWVSAAHAVEAETRLYDRLFTVENPLAAKDASFRALLNPQSLVIVRAYLEPSLADAAPGERFQFERLGYFCADTSDSAPGRPVFNRTVPLRDSWARRKGRD